MPRHHRWFSESRHQPPLVIPTLIVWNEDLMVILSLEGLVQGVNRPFSVTSRILWTADPPYPMDGEDYYVAIARDRPFLMANSWNGVRVGLNPFTGGLLWQEYTK